MSRVQVDLPDELHRQAELAGLSISEILQEALQAELSRREKLAAIDQYLTELAAETGVALSEEL